MSLTKIFCKGAVALSVFSLFLVSCDNKEQKNSSKTESAASTKKDDGYAETVADYICEDAEIDGEKFWAFTINFIAEEGSEESIATDGKSMKNRPIESHFIMRLEDIEKKKGYKPGIKPLKHQKIKIRYEKEEPVMFYPLENLKYQDKQGNVIELE